MLLTDVLCGTLFLQLNVARVLSALLLWSTMVYDMHLSQPHCGLISLAAVWIYGLWMGCPAGLMCIWSGMELAGPTWGKRAAIPSPSSVSKRPAMSSAAAGSSTDVPVAAIEWNAANHDRYLREQLVINPDVIARELDDLVEKDYGLSLIHI